MSAHEALVEPRETPLGQLRDGPQPDVTLGVFFAGGGPKGIGPAESGRIIGEEGLIPDVVGGRSAGGATGLAHVSGQWNEAVNNYYELFGRGFGDPIAALRYRRLIADPDMLHEVISSQVDAKRACANPDTLFVCSRARMNDLVTERVTNRDSTPYELVEAVVDGMRLFPPFGRARKDAQGRKYADPGILGGGSEAWDAALSGCTHAVIFDSKPYKEWGINWHGMVLLGLWAHISSDKGINGFSKVAKAALEQRSQINSYRETGRIITNGVDGQPRETLVQVVHTGTHSLGGLAISHGKASEQLFECVTQAREATLRALDDPASVPLITRPRASERSTIDETIDIAWQATMSIGRRAIRNALGHRRVAF